MSEKLFLREWVVIFLVMGVVACFAMSAWVTRFYVERELTAIEEVAEASQLTLSMEGAVKQPGVYHFPCGVSLRQVIKLVPLTKEADRSELDLDRVFYQSEEIVIPFKNSPVSKTMRKNREQTK